MSLGTSNRDGGKTSESGHLRALAKIVLGDVIEGLAVSQRAAGVNMSVDVAIGDAFVRRSDGSYAHPVFNDAVYNQVISAADGSNPRRDIIVLYVDYGQTPSTAVSNNTNGVVKIKVVNGTPAGSPVDPNDAAIQSSVGAGNPFTKLARVRVPAGQTSISNSLIDDLRTMIYANANSVPTSAIPDSAITAAKVALSAVGLTKLDATTFVGATDANGWRLTYNPQGKRIWTKRISQAISLPNGISFANYSIGSAPNVVVSAGGVTNFDVTHSIIMPSGSRQIATSIMESGGALELGAINNFTGGSYSGTVRINITITEP